MSQHSDLIEQNAAVIAAGMIAHEWNECHEKASQFLTDADREKFRRAKVTRLAARAVELAMDIHLVAFAKVAATEGPKP